MFIEKPIKVVFGVDIEKGSSHSIPRYSVAVVGEDTVEEIRGVSKYKILRLAKKYKPEMIACDNIFELSRDKRELVNLLSMLPPNTKLVQVTDREHSLSALAKAHGIRISKTDPLDEARACAKLALLGVGHAVEVFENKTKIIVSRGRSLGRGGWSQNRYRRKVHGAVREMARNIERTLKEGGFEFEMNTKKGFGGYSRVEFVVEGARDKVPISSSRHADVRVVVSGVERSGIEFVPLAKKKYIIVGIDPGTTMGIAAFDLHGNLLGTTSERGLSISDAIEKILSFGIPVVFASDVAPAPKTVERLSRMFGVECVVSRLSVDEKRRLSSQFNPKNDHERDAIAAAYHAFRMYKNKLLKAEMKAPPFSDIEQIKADVIRQKKVKESYATSKPEIEGKKEETPTDEEKERLRDKISKQKKTIKRLTEYNQELKREIEERDEEIERLRERVEMLRSEVYREMRRDELVSKLRKDVELLRNEIRKRDEEIERLRERVEMLKAIRKKEMDGSLIPLKVVDRFTRECIRSNVRKGDVVYLKDASGGGAGTAEILHSLSPRAVLYEGEMAHSAYERFLELGLPVIKAEGVVLSFDDALCTSPSSLNKAIEAWMSEREEWKRKRDEERISSIISEYRTERAKELRKGR
ncbi:DUF460 domain-containing protein [Methanosarcinales archaeon]|nr:MAG: DUF460 domain-containing protein [Methanosarcinales archaeon]